MNKNAANRRAKAPNLKGDRLVGRCSRALKLDVARALAATGLDESKLVRLSIELVLPALSAGKMVYQNGKLVAVGNAPATNEGGLRPTGTEGGR